MLKVGGRCNCGRMGGGLVGEWWLLALVRIGWWEGVDGWTRGRGGGRRGRTGSVVGAGGRVQGGAGGGEGRGGGVW